MFCRCSGSDSQPFSGPTEAFFCQKRKKWDPRGLQVAFFGQKREFAACRWGPLGTAGDRWGPLGIARVARDGSGLSTSKVTAGHVAAVHGHVSRIALLVVSPRLGWEAKRTDYLPRVRSLNGGWTLYLPYAVPAIFGSPHMIKNRPPMIKNDETTIRTAGGASQSR